MFICVSDSLGMAAQLAISAADRLLSGFRPSTMRQYHRMWSDLFAFQEPAELLPCQVTVQMLLSFLEFLHHNAISAGQISNYLTALRALHIVYGLDASAFKDEHLPLFLKSLKFQAPFKPRLVFSLDIELLQRIVEQCDKFSFSVVFKTTLFGRFFLIYEIVQFVAPFCKYF